jgi:crotonobetainyl-CoA:carnitine CoA-transferase CaiB-like acyl-CoA transferase
LRILSEKDVPPRPVYVLREVFSDTQLTKRCNCSDKAFNRGRDQSDRDTDEILKHKSGIRSPAPLLGEHVEYVVGTLLGYDERRIAQLRHEGVV